MEAGMTRAIAVTGRRAAGIVGQRMLAGDGGEALGTFENVSSRYSLMTVDSTITLPS
ncbi:MAG: hypothetical protein WB760_04170 [Xanthobacteraceae bacterium]